MASRRTGATSRTTENLTLNAGVVFRDFVVGTDTYDSAKAAGKIISATQGGTNFTATMETQEFPIDGADPYIKKTGTNCTLAVSFVENTPEVMALAMATGIVEDKDDFYAVRAKREIESSDYLESITIMSSLTGSNEPIYIQMFDVIATSGVAINSQDNNLTLIPITFKAKSDESKRPEDADFDPYIIYYPKPFEQIVFEPVSSTATQVTGTGKNGATVHLSGGTIPKDTTGVVAEGKFNIVIPVQSAGTAIAGYQTIGTRRSKTSKVYVKLEGTPE